MRSFEGNSDSPFTESDAWIAEAQNGSQASLEQLLASTRDYLRRLAAPGIGADIQGQLSASDLVQETMMVAHREFASFRGTATPQFRAWLRRILVHRLINHYRRLKDTKKNAVDRVKAIPDMQQIASRNEQTPSGIAIQNEEAAMLEDALRSLNDSYREVILMRHREQLTFPQIAARMGKTTDAVRMLWYRAFDELSRDLQRPRVK